MQQGPMFTYRMSTGSLVQPFFPGQPAYLSRDAALSYLGDFSGKPIQVQAGPLVRIRFDVSGLMPPRAQPPQRITNVGTVLDEENGVDAATGSRLYGAPGIEPGGTSVHQDLLGLAANGLYVITFTVLIGTLQQRFKVPFFTTSESMIMAVREVDTVLPITGGPITDVGSIGLQTPLAIQYGGTGAITANAALDSLSGASGSNAGILERSPAGTWSVTAVPAGPLAVAGGGTGATTGNAALDSLSNSSGSVAGHLERSAAGVWSITADLPTPFAINVGGTGATSPAGALDNLSGASGSIAGHLERSSGGTWSVVADIAQPFAIGIGGTGATTGNAALDSLSATSGSTSGTLGRSAGGVWSVSPAGIGTITGVTAGNGLTGGGTTGTVTVGISAPVSIANGGTGAITAGAALTSLGAAPIASPTFTGTPTAPTQPVGTINTDIATTAFCSAGFLALSGGTLTGSLHATTMTAGTVEVTGASAAFELEDQTTNTNVWPMFVNGNVLHIQNATPADLCTMNGNTAVSFAGSVISGFGASGAAPNAGFSFFDRTGAFEWEWYSTGGTARLWLNGSDIFTFSSGGNLGTAGNVNAAACVAGTAAGLANSGLYFYDQTGTGTQWRFVGSGNTAFLASGGNNLWSSDASGNFQILGSTATKPGSTSWVNPSDRSLKQEIEPYTQGLDAVLNLKPVSYRYSGEHGLPTERKFIGLVHDETTHMPEMHETVKLGDVEVEGLDSGPLVFALINAVKALSAKVAALEAARTSPA